MKEQDDDEEEDEELVTGRRAGDWMVRDGEKR